MTQPESITRALDVWRCPGTELNSDVQLAAAALATAYARELDPTPISADALVADGWDDGRTAFRCRGLECYQVGCSTWRVSFCGSFRTLTTMGAVRTLQRALVSQ